MARNCIYDYFEDSNAEKLTGGAYSLSAEWELIYNSAPSALVSPDLLGLTEMDVNTNGMLPFDLLDGQDVDSNSDYLTVIPDSDVPDDSIKVIFSDANLQDSEVLKIHSVNNLNSANYASSHLAVHKDGDIGPVSPVSPFSDVMAVGSDPFMNTSFILEENLLHVSSRVPRAMLSSDDIDADMADSAVKIEDQGIPDGQSYDSEASVSQTSSPVHMHSYSNFNGPPTEDGSSTSKVKLVDRRKAAKKKVKLYEHEPYVDPDKERCRKNAVSAKLNRIRKKKELDDLISLNKRLLVENRKLKEDLEDTNQKLTLAMEVIAKISQSTKKSPRKKQNIDDPEE